MVQINFAQKTVNVKIVYYGPGMSGKTTNLELLHERAPKNNCGDLTSISTDGDRTLFFDYMPLDLGTVAGMRTCFQLYTVPGQVYYNSTRKLVLQGVDGVIFVADSSGTMTEQNLESLRNLEENLNEYGKNLATMPHVIQYNKRDLPDAMDVADLDRLLNQHGAPTFEGVANVGTGVFPTLKALAANVLKTLMHENSRGAQPGAAMPAAQPAAAQAAPVAPVGVAPAAPAAPAGVAPGAPAAAPAGTFGAAPVAAQASPPPAPPAAAPSLELATSEPVPDRGSPLSAAPAAPQAAAPAPRPVARKTAVTKPPARTHAVPQSPRAQRRAPKREPIAAPRPKNKSWMTGTFVVLAAGAGAVLAWFALKLL